MKVPAHIRNAIRKSAKHYAIAVESNNIVREWIDEILGEEYTGKLGHDMFLDQLIDGTEISCNPEGVIKQFEEYLKLGVHSNG
jgi:hypothetical protein